MLVGGGGGGFGPPPYKTFYHRKTDFLFVKQSFLAKFRQPVRSSWVKQSGETYPKNFVSQRENQFFGGKKSCRGWGPKPRPTSKWQISAVAMFAVYRIRCYLSSRLSPNVFGENIKNPI